MPTHATVTAADIARLAGVGRAAVSNWRRRYDDFPRPVAGTANNPLFDLATVQTWLNEQGKSHRVSPWDRLWQLVEAHRGDQESADFLAGVGMFLIYLETAGRGAWSRLHTMPDEELRTALPPAIDTATAKLAGMGRQRFPLDVARVQVLREVAELAAEVGGAATFTGLLDRFIHANSRWMSVTAPALARLMADLACVRDGVVLDPACGTGTMLAAASAPGVRRVGVEIDQGLARIAAIRLALIGGDAEIRVGDSLLADAFAGRLVDAVVCAPPFNERHWGHEELLNDPRWEYGIPPRMESELAWLQHSVAHVKPGGTVVLCMPPSAASRRSGRRIRAELLRSGVLRGVLALPGPAAPTHVWVLRRPQPGVVDGTQLLVVDASRVEWDRAGELAVAAWRAFDDPARAVEPRPGEVRAVPVLDLLTEEIDLTPARNLPVSSAGSPTQLRSRQRELAERLAELVGRLPAHDWGPPVDLRVVSTVAELMKAGAVSIQHSNPATEPTRPGDHGAPGEVALLDVDDLLAGRVATTRVSREFAGTCVRTEPGDVVAPMVGGRMVARVLGGGVALARGLCLLRPNPQVLDPWFLAGFLSGSMNSRQASTHLSAAARLDVRRCEIPRLPLADQHRYAAVFQGLAAFDTTLTAMTGLAREMVQATTDGLTDGIIAPPPNAG